MAVSFQKMATSSARRVTFHFMGLVPSFKMRPGMPTTNVFSRVKKHMWCSVAALTWLKQHAPTVGVTLDTSSMAKNTHRPTSATESTHAALNMLTGQHQMASLERIKFPSHSIGIDTCRFNSHTACSQFGPGEFQ